MHPNKRPTTSTELFDLILNGERPVVKFRKDAEDFETCIDRGMYGRIVSVEHKENEFFLMRVDLNEFESHNDGCMQRNYYDSDGNPCLTSKEADQYPKDGIETIYFDYDRDLAPYFEFEDSEVQQIVPVKITSAVVHQTEGNKDVIIVGTPAPIPLSGIEGNVQMILVADEGTGVDYLATHFGIRAEVASEEFDIVTALDAYGLNA